MPKSSIISLQTLLTLIAVAMLNTAAFPKDDQLTLSEISNSFNSLSEKVSPAVVNIVAVGWQGPSEQRTAALLSKTQHTGSGVVLDVNGYIVTNAHVVEGAHKIEVTLNRNLDDSSKFKSILKPRGETIEAELIGLDLETDLAVIKIPLTGLHALELADSDELKQGQLVFAFGSPLGLQNSVSMGVVSSIARQLTPEDPMIFIQTDAAINPGNSGGPLVNIDGKVVGVNTLIFSQSGGNEGLGFAAPSNIVKNVYHQIKTNGRVRRGEIGVRAQTITPIMAKLLELSQDWGVILGDVFPGTPADQSGLRLGDIILSLNGKQMENGRQFNVNLYSKGVGDTVTLEVMRNGKPMTIETTVIERDDDYEKFASFVSPEENRIDQLGILGLDLSADIIDMLPKLRKETGVLVAVTKTSPSYEERGFNAGDIIHAINKTQIAGLAGLRRTLSAFAHDETIVVQIERRREFMYLVITLE
jgi:serine protease Do